MQRAPVGIARTGGGKPAREGRRAAEAILERRLVDEQQVVDDFVGDAAHHLRDAGLFAGIGDERRVQPWIRRARFPRGACEQVGHVDLMREHEQGGNVARHRLIAIGLEQTAHRGQFAPGVARKGRGRIPAVPDGRAAAGHEPAAPALLDRRAVIGEDRSGRALPAAVGRAEHQQPRHAERVAGHVTPQAGEHAPELGPIHRTLVERIKDDALLLVLRRDFDDLAVPHPAERRAIVEEQRARVALADEFSLKAGRRKDQHLRVGCNVERGQRRPEIAAATLEGQTDAAVAELCIDLGDRILQRRA